MKKDKIFISLFCYICGSIILQIGLDTFVNQESILLNSVGIIVNYLLLISLFIWLNRFELQKMLKDFKKHYLKYLKWIIILWLSGFFLMIIINYLIYYVFTSDIKINANEQSVLEMRNKLIIASFIVYSFLGPILEELVFRLGFNTIKNQYLYLAVTSLLFASLHVLGDLDGLMFLLYILPYLVLGITFGLAYQKTNNIFTAIIVHVLHNTLIGLFIIFI